MFKIYTYFSLEPIHLKCLYLKHILYPVCHCSVHFLYFGSISSSSSSSIHRKPEITHLGADFLRLHAQNLQFPHNREFKTTILYEILSCQITRTEDMKFLRKLQVYKALIGTQDMASDCLEGGGSSCVTRYRLGRRYS